MMETKSVAIPISHEEGDQIFSYHRGEDILHFNVTLLARIRAAAPEAFRKIEIELTPDIYNVCMDHRGIEEPKVEALTATQLREPGYAVVFPEGDYTVVDGHHRIVRRYRGGARTMDLYFCPLRDIWQHCLVPYTEEETAHIASFLPERVQGAAMIPTVARLRDEGQS